MALLCAAVERGGRAAVRELLLRGRLEKATASPAWPLFASLPWVAELVGAPRRIALSTWASLRPLARAGRPIRCSAVARVLAGLPRAGVAEVYMQLPE